jgi:hypothetical protein
MGGVGDGSGMGLTDIGFLAFHCGSNMNKNRGFCEKMPPTNLQRVCLVRDSILAP